MAEAAAPARADATLLAEVAAGLAQPLKELPPKFFYDLRGSELFEEITRLPEYYLTRTERALLERWMLQWIAALRPRTLTELGAGAAVKTRILLDEMRRSRLPLVYVPVDVSAEFLGEIAEELRRDYPEVEIRPVVADLTDAFALPAGLPEPTLLAFLGSTIGNFHPPDAARLLGHVRAGMSPGDRFLLGVDLRKDTATLEAAYNDAAGVTAEFNLNLLRVVNAQAGTDFDPAAYRHHAFYDEREHRIEMHLVADRPQMVRVPGAGVVRIAAGESIRTEVSYKHDRESVTRIFAAAGLTVERWETDAAGRYALVLALPV